MSSHTPLACGLAYFISSGSKVPIEISFLKLGKGCGLRKGDVIKRASLLDNKEISVVQCKLAVDELQRKRKV